MTSSRLCGLALALGLSTMLGGCVIAPDESEDEIDEASSALDVADGPGGPGSAPGDGENSWEPDPLPWKGAGRTGSTDDSGVSASLAGERQDPDPLPWQPDKNDGDSKVQSGVDQKR